ncbi:BTAD domain-containing putative transcriptional regulator [Oryzobacter telluris]|uniref:nSTAND1 domain-containing NTPase n=1 Tax=Oryzobacter telluris TaxID=3149179 RepID=UPI00370D51C0
MRVGVLGPLEVDGGAVSLGPRDRAALLVLVLRQGSPVRPDTIAEALWGEDPPASAAKVVQGCVVRLRRALGPSSIETVDGGYRLQLHRDEVDAVQFEELAGRARALLAQGQPDRAHYLLTRATDLWRGEPFADLDGWEPARIESERLLEERRDAEDLAAEVDLALGRHEEVATRGTALVREQPTREQRWAALALAQYRCGRQADALATLQRARALLVTELGLDPGPALAALEQAVLRQDPSLDPPEVLDSPGETCPYPGLLAHEAEDAAAFFGREADVAAGLHRLDETGVLAVVGPSGCGKSSLLRAGVAAALLADGQLVTVLTPGPEPLTAVDGVRLGRRTALVVDQCEEVFAAHPDQVRQFLAVLADHHRRGGLLVIGLRADRIGELSAHTHLARLVETGLHLLGPLSVEGLREAVEGPAAQAGLRLEDGLVELLVRDVEGEPGALPLLSHVLRRTWELREGRTLTVAAYRSTGGVREAVAQSAEELFRSLGAEDRVVLRELMTRLVTTGENGGPVRTRVPRRAVDRDVGRRDLVERLVVARLLSADADSVEVAHESLAVAWPRLRSWLDEDVDGQRILRHLSVAAQTWAALGRPESELYRGVRQVRAGEWVARTHPVLADDELDFLAASAALADREQRATEEQVRHERRANRRLRAGLVATVVLALLATTAGVFASLASRRADAAATSSDARRLGAEALRSKDLDTALLLSVAGMRLDASPDTRANLLATLDRAPDLVRMARTPRLVGLALSPRAGLVLAQAPDEGLVVRRADTLAPVSVHADLRGAAVVVSPDGATAVATPMADLVERGVVPAVVVLDPDGSVAAEQLGGIPAGRYAQQNVSIGPDSRWLGVTLLAMDGDAAPLVGVWDLTARSRPVALLEPGDQAERPLVAAGGRSLWTSGGGALRETALPSGRVVRTLTPQALDLGTVDDPFAISPDGSTLVVAAGTQLAFVDTAGAHVRHVVPVVGGVDRVAFSADGSRLASSGDTLMVWDTSGEEPVAVLEQDDGGGWPSFDASGGTLYTAAFDGMVMAWDLTGRRGFLPSVGGESASDGVGLARFSPDGRRLLRVSAGEVATFTVQDVATGVESRRVDVNQSIASWLDGAWSPDGSLVTVQTRDDVLAVWDATTVAEVARRDLPVGEQVLYAEFTTDGGLLVGTTQGRVHVLDARTLAPRRDPVDVAPPRDGAPAGLVGVLHARPGTTEVLAVAEGGEPVVVDTASGAVRPLDLGVEGFGLAWSPDGERLAVTTTDGAVGLRDVDARRWVVPPSDRQPFAGYALTFSPDGSEFSTTASGRVGRWDGRTGAFLGAVSVDGAAAVGYLPGGSALVVAQDAGPVRRWDLDPASWVRTACAVAGRELSVGEWRDHLPDRDYRPVCGTGATPG